MIHLHFSRILPLILRTEMSSYEDVLNVIRCNLAKKSFSPYFLSIITICTARSVLWVVAVSSVSVISVTAASSLTSVYQRHPDWEQLQTFYKKLRFHHHHHLWEPHTQEERELGSMIILQMILVTVVSRGTEHSRESEVWEEMRDTSWSNLRRNKSRLSTLNQWNCLLFQRLSGRIRWQTSQKKTW